MAFIRGLAMKTILLRALATGAVVLGLSLVGYSQLRMQQIVDQQEREATLRVATQCVASHERIEEIRDSVEFVITTNADTLLQLATPESDPARIARFKALVEGDVQEARQTIGMPDCNLRDAEQLLAAED